ncbi:anthranilate phosphoribosyltransferase family protein [Romeria aff. gracilis LEGE 07310]|uniref:Anthranilate phosphoribosyltransferase family protein n=1 Tax=Vasconcelosia minhoensis LEGE 07310 TaxID=915328 RepID=A0A8J7A8F3_9CYAN|nr:anthranilate phosphoribosyltransferase family protein [Romeria gracilis]MBE9079052.1 anthranilate phosphoribosyltransferase family protein [Romeria aff. gracilis LEGE 07310]
MSRVFRDLLKKVGSGSHTSTDLSREEAAIATRMMLKEEATPVQIGAFMIAHRIKRPTPVELAGMLDCYDSLGPQLALITADYPVTIFNSPYDGRTRTAPVSPITALTLAAAGAPAILHGGDRMPTKLGLPLIEVWQGLGLAWERLTLTQVQQVLETTGLGFVYLPHHFPTAQAMVPYRDQIGKRPPFATVELMWSPYPSSAHNSHLVSGFVHPPTEDRTQITFQLRQTPFFTTVKGLEGSCDLARSRTAIIGLGQLRNGELNFERLLLHPRDYGFEGADPDLLSLPELTDTFQVILQGKPGPLMTSVVWNAGFYLWRCGATPTIEAGFKQAENLLQAGAVRAKLAEVRGAIADCAPQTDLLTAH